MAVNVNLFKDLRKASSSMIKLGNGDVIKVEGQGSVVIKTPTGNKIIPNVFYVPNIEENLFGLEQMLENNYNLIFKDHTCKILDPSHSELMSVAMKCRSFH